MIIFPAIDSSNDLQGQLKRLSDAYGYSMRELNEAWQRQQNGNLTVLSVTEEIYFDVRCPVEPKPEDTFQEKKLSYVAQQKKKPKFLR